MARKYIKGKGGKFQGSVPSRDSAPQSAPAELPRRAATPSWVPASGFTPVEKLDELEDLRERAREANTHSRSLPLFSAKRRKAKQEAKVAKEDFVKLRKEMERQCWRCYGTGKPMNSFADNYDIFQGCPECDRDPSDAPRTTYQNPSASYRKEEESKAASWESEKSRADFLRWQARSGL